MEIKNIQYNTEGEQSFFTFENTSGQYLVLVEQKVSFFKNGILAVQTLKGNDLIVTLVKNDPVYNLVDSNVTELNQMVRDVDLIKEFIKFILATNERFAIAQSTIDKALENATIYGEGFTA
ncbi:hypothetical protein [Geminocystis sp. NIES-3709]|uniref:hypothetical protein n=1 Tax=Geminocystis sp. NIES-3709 TaxID=1617448 RepID=UPI0008241085|nr:hypothetical protein [Geminocystis sp. NIES-3709]